MVRNCTSQRQAYHIDRLVMVGLCSLGLQNLGLHQCFLQQLKACHLWKKEGISRVRRCAGQMARFLLPVMLIVVKALGKLNIANKWWYRVYAHRFACIFFLTHPVFTRLINVCFEWAIRTLIQRLLFMWEVGRKWKEGNIVFIDKGYIVII